jgi:DNA-binding winged helix-turn-helix (wHTH) protein
MIDLDQGLVSGPNGASGLTPRAEDLLLLLSRRANTLVSREDILETVWAGRVVEDAAITNCVWQIRRALGPDGKDILQTRTKRGYVLVVADSAWLRAFSESAPAIPQAPTAASAEAPSAVVDPAVDLAAADTAEASAEASDAMPPTAAVSAAAAVPAATRTASLPLRRGAYAVASAALMALVVFVGWRVWGPSSKGVVLGPQTEMSAAVLAPESLGWLRETLLRKTIEQAHLRDLETVVFQREQRENPFRGPHLQVEIERGDALNVEAELELVQGETRLRERYDGPPDGLPAALQTLLGRHLPARTRQPGPATDAYVSGRLAEMRFDRASAALEYRRALGLDARMSEARIALAGLLFEQGRIAEAREIAQPLAPREQRDPVHRCRIERLLARIAPERLEAKHCARAEMVARIERLELREAMREIERLHARPAGAWEWLEQEEALILALLRLQDLERAEYEIDRARGIAEGAGWPYAALRLQAYRASVHMHRGERAKAALVQRELAQGFEAFGDDATAVDSRIQMLRAEPILPGPANTRRREALDAIAEQARAAGNLRGEIDALLLLARGDRDLPQSWRANLDRARERLRDARLDGSNSLYPYLIAAEIVGARRYAEALQDLGALLALPQRHPRGDSWGLHLSVEAHFWRDEIEAAVAVLDRMEGAGLDITAAPNPCFFAWVLTEAGRRERATAYLERCRNGTRGPGQTDYGLMAEVRQRVLDGEPARAWPLLRPRIEALTALPRPDRQDAETLSLLARYSRTLPGADDRVLARADAVVQRMAGLDGAGPGLRLGAYLLRQPPCPPTAETGCPAIALPPWAEEDRLIARLAEGRPAVAPP